MISETCEAILNAVTHRRQSGRSSSVGVTGKSMEVLFPNIARTDMGFSWSMRHYTAEDSLRHTHSDNAVRLSENASQLKH